MLAQQPSFTRAGALAGARLALPLAISSFVYGLVFGVLARQAGMSFAEAVLMSGMVSAGASQFAVLALWAAPLPVLAIVVTTLVVNARHLLLGAALRPWFGQLSARQSYGSVFFLFDENWALSMREFAEGRRDAAVVLGSGLALFGAWVGATGIGYVAAASVPDPARWGLDFAFTAVVAALLVGMWRPKADLLPWCVAAAVAVAAERWLPGTWYIVLGGLAGGLAGALRHER